MELWQQVDWQYPLEKSSLNAFSRTFRVKLSKLGVLGEVAPVLCRSRFWISFDPNGSVYSAVNKLVEHLIGEYGLEVVMKDRGLYKTAGQRTWELPTDPKQGARAIAALKQAEPMLEARPYVKNGSSETLGWAVFSSSDWAELEAADLYATRALFPLKGAVPQRPPGPKPMRDGDRAPQNMKSCWYGSVQTKKNSHLDLSTPWNSWRPRIQIRPRSGMQ